MNAQVLPKTISVSWKQMWMTTRLALQLQVEKQETWFLY